MVIEKIYKFSKENKTINQDISNVIIDEITNNKSFNSGVVELAEKAKCSQPSATRYVQNQLKMNNYKEFQIILNKEISSYFEEKFAENNYQDNIETLVSDLRATFKNNPDNKIEAAAEMILNAEKINVAAMGGNTSLKFAIEHKLIQIGKHSMMGVDWHQQIMNINYMEENDVVILLSYSGDKAELKKIFEKAKERNIKIISLTGDFDTEMKRGSDINFSTISSDAKYRSFSFSSRICAYAIWEMVFKSILSKDIVTSDIMEQWKWEQA
ncbi:MurR/RpiR family transcriptional regulator [[Acholeplasma] multilocale]|uniref:MurR/RpiR family transcriptional regulator n=1 Tax=[Acholeplasma] multilocale TaxID=264638 RepID=UPI00055202D5|nr:MurR/RpiR family transcriptional regulator [[Acholeplasma] multilocale]